MTNAGTIAVLVLGSYLFGSIPFGLWLVMRWKGIDIRTVGSGNIGATNVGRVAGSKAYAMAFTFDVLKGLLPPLIGIALRLDSQWQILGALAGILGHNYSIFIGFKGGKGISTSLGALIGAAPLVGIGAVTLFLVEVLTLHYISLGSVLAALSLPFFSLWLYPGDHYRLAFTIVACVLAVYKHRANIQRLRSGTEPKVRMFWQKRNRNNTDVKADTKTESTEPSHG